MKNLAIRLLCAGISKTKTDIEKLYQYCYIFKYLVKRDDCFICCNNNKFWKYENNDKRTELLHDILKSGKGIKGKYEIFNRFENGDGYGIER